MTAHHLQCTPRAARPTRRAELGFSLIELLVAVAIMLVITGAIFSMVDPSRGSARAQTEVSDQQQRMRVSADTITKDLIMAGAGTYSGAIAGTLLNFFAPVLPYVNGALPEYSGWNAPVPRFFQDQITIAYVPNTAAQTRVRDPMPQPSSEIKVDAQPGCPANDALCGFRVNMRVVIFDDTGAYDFFTITEVQTDALHLQHRPPNPDFSKAYTPAENARIAQIETHSYLIDRNRNEFQHYTGWTDLPEAVATDMVDFRVDYFGDPNPPLEPRPAIGNSNCVIDAAGDPKLPTLSADGTSLVELTREMLTDATPAQLCGVAPNQFDPDLYRVRKVRISFRAQAARPDLRAGGPMFWSPGFGPGGTRLVPDYEMTFDVAPRNLNLTR